MPTVGARLRATIARLREAGVPSPEHDAIVLIAHTLGLEPSHVRLAAVRDDEWPDGADLDRLETRVTRRIDREPLQHITGTAYFRSVELQVGPGVFVPRPETEVVAGVAIDAARASLATRGTGRVTDLCAGSGAIGISVAAEVPDAQVSLVEASEEALVYLRLNARAQPAEVRARLRTVYGDARNCLRRFDACADVVVCNPPYVPLDAVPRDPEVALHDPPQALYGLGDDGLEVPRAIIDEAQRLLRVGGTLVMEHGDEQGPALRAYAESSEWWGDVHTLTDLTGRDRMLVATRTGV
ncbi:peptide chain release factor N(5)-glutamine methyltransferase [Demequina pelophila]|uniref:peptide chain release factor N(5)-glutamine methyltransferase n=1 Tax=Demequina pelophila TaxID=1638984 RepID=UPI000780A7F5|nr:peptide chain release factor N(5)-glutamine methyltransferase [Demequina pelophila]